MPPPAAQQAPLSTKPSAKACPRCECFCWRGLSVLAWLLGRKAELSQKNHLILDNSGMSAAGAVVRRDMPWPEVMGRGWPESRRGVGGAGGSVGTHRLCVPQAALPPTALASSREQAAEAGGGSGVSPLASSPLAGNGSTALVISSLTSDVSCFGRTLCNSLVAPCHCSPALLPAPALVIGLRGALSTSHRGLRGVGLGVLQEGGHSTVIWWGRVMQHLCQPLRESPAECRGPVLQASGGEHCLGDHPLSGAQGWQLQQARGVAGTLLCCPYVAFLQGLVDPHGRVWVLAQGVVLAGGPPSTRWQMGAAAPGVEVAVSVPCLSPHNPQLVLPRAAVFTLAVTVLTLPLDVSYRGWVNIPTLPLLSRSPLPTWLAAGWEQDVGRSAGRRHWVGNAVLEGWVLCL